MAWRFIFTSASPGEGKTFSCTNYAAVLARQGLRTAYIQRATEGQPEAADEFAAKAIDLSQSAHKAAGRE